MTISLAVLFFLAIWHLIYEQALAPAMRMKQRDKLFALRDELRMVCIKDPEAIDVGTFNLLEGAINNYLRIKSNMDLITIYKINRMIEENGGLDPKIKRAIAKIERHENPRVNAIFQEAARVSALTVMINHGAWLLYIFPFVMVYWILRILKMPMAWLLGFAKGYFSAWKGLTIDKTIFNQLLPSHNPKYTSFG